MEGRKNDIFAAHLTEIVQSTMTLLQFNAETVVKIFSPSMSTKRGINHCKDHTTAAVFNPLLLLLNSRCTIQSDRGNPDLSKAYSSYSLRCIHPRARLPPVQRRCVRKKLLYAACREWEHDSERNAVTPKGEGFQMFPL